jgi:hypothetical protein
MLDASEKVVRVIVLTLAVIVLLLDVFYWRA